MVFLFVTKRINGINDKVRDSMPLVSSIIPPIRGQSKAVFLLQIHKLQQRSCYTFSKPCILYSIVNFKEIYHSRDSRYDEMANYYQIKRKRISYHPSSESLSSICYSTTSFV